MMISVPQTTKRMPLQGDMQENIMKPLIVNRLSFLQNGFSTVWEIKKPSHFEKVYQNGVVITEYYILPFSGTEWTTRY
jgi:hypothetical protein